MKRAIIIGATSGIGRALAKIYLQDGWQVGVTGRRKELLDQLQQQSPKNVFIECFDVMGPDNIIHLKSLIEKLGGLDLLIYNSGIGSVSKNLDWDIDRRTTLTNVNGFIEIINYAFNFFVNQGYGQLAATSSIASIRGNSHAPAYSASKAFMSVYMEGLFLKARKMNSSTGERLNISVTDIQPGFVNTTLSKDDKRFWAAPVDKAARQIFNAIRKKKRRVYITGRWRIVAWLLKNMPFWIYRNVG